MASLLVAPSDELSFPSDADGFGFGDSGSSGSLWQRDEDVAACPLCEAAFSVFHRRHHCRKCGRVVCHPCSRTRTSYLPFTQVASPVLNADPKRPHRPHRTCDECAQDLAALRTAILARPGSSSARSTVSRRSTVSSASASIFSAKSRASSSAASSVLDQPNRMTLYTLCATNDTDTVQDTCAVCFEAFQPGARLARLECRCVFHEPCVTAWFAKKGAGSCPVHSAS